MKTKNRYMVGNGMVGYNFIVSSVVHNKNNGRAHALPLTIEEAIAIQSGSALHKTGLSIYKLVPYKPKKARRK